MSLLYIGAPGYATQDVLYRQSKRMQVTKTKDTFRYSMYLAKLQSYLPCVTAISYRDTKAANYSTYTIPMYITSSCTLPQTTSGPLE